MLLPVIFMTLFVVILLTVLFSRAYINMILRQENDVNAVGFETVSHSIPPLISSSVSEVQRIMADDRVAAYARLQYASKAELVHGRIDCRDFLRGEIARHDGIFGLLFMRQDGSLFGVLPEGCFAYGGIIYINLSNGTVGVWEYKGTAANVVIPETVQGKTVTEICEAAFENNKTLQSITLPGTIQYIRKRAFANCTSLSTMNS